MTRKELKQLEARLRAKIEEIHDGNQDQQVDRVEMNSSLWTSFVKHGTVSEFRPRMDDGCVGTLHGDNITPVFINDSLAGTNVVMTTKDV
jgi:hypothetical protein